MEQKQEMRKMPVPLRILRLLGYCPSEDPVPIGKLEKGCICLTIILSAVYAVVSTICLIGTTGLSLWVAGLLNLICVCQSAGTLLRQHEEFISRKRYIRMKESKKSAQADDKRKGGTDLFYKPELVIAGIPYEDVGEMTPYKRRLFLMVFTLLILTVIAVTSLISLYTMDNNAGTSPYAYAMALLLIVMCDIWIDQAVAFYRAEA